MPPRGVPRSLGLFLSTLLLSPLSANRVCGGDPAAPVAAGPDLRVPGVLFGTSRRTWGTEQPTTLLAWSRDGKRVASSTGGNVLLWDMPAARQRQSLPAHKGGTRAVAFGPGETVFTGGADGVVQEWCAATGARLRRFEGHRGSVLALAVARDGKVLASGGGDSTARLWDLSTGKELRRVERPRNEGVSALAISPDGKALATAGYYALCLWDAGSGKLLRELADFRPPLCTGVHFTPDGGRVVAGSRATCYVWDARSGKQVASFAWDAPFGHDCSSAVTPDGKEVALGPRLYDLAGRGPRECGPRSMQGICAAFSPDGRHLVGGTVAGQFDCSEVATGQILQSVGGHRASVHTLAVSPDGKRLATASTDETVRLWDADSGDELRCIAGLTGASVTFLPGDGRLVVGDGESLVRRFDSRQGKEADKLDLGGWAASTLAVAAGGKLLAVGGRDGVALVDPASGKMLRKMPWPGEPKLMWSLTFSPDGGERLRVSTGRTLTDEGPQTVHEILRWPAAPGKGVARPGTVATGEWLTVYSPDGRYLGLAGVRGMRLVSRVSGREIHWPEGRRLGTTALAFAPDGRTFVTSDRPLNPPNDELLWAKQGSSVLVWETATRRLRGRLSGHAGNVTCLAFSADGKQVFSGSEDSSARVWDLYGPEPGAKPKPLTARELEARWEDLAGADAAKAFGAVRALVQDPERAVKFLAERLHKSAPPKRVTAERLHELIREMDDKRFAVRERATRELVEAGEALVPALLKALKAQLSLETRRRLEQALDRILAGQIPPERLRLLRVAEVLDRIGTAEARRLLREMEPN